MRISDWSSYVCSSDLTPVRHPRPPGAAGAVKKTEPAMSRSHPPVSIIRAPTDIGAGTRGARMGPEALRVAGLVEALAARGIDVVARGNVADPRHPRQPPVEGYRHNAAEVPWNRTQLNTSTHQNDPT